MVLQRDGKCLKCGTTENLTVDHIVPKFRGGLDGTDNLQTLCKSCNMKKGASMPIRLTSRILQAFNVEQIVYIAKDELKSMIKQYTNKLRADFEAGFLIKTKSQDESLRLALGKQDKVIVALHRRIRLMEQYHKIEYIDELFVEGHYEKVKKKKP